MTEVENADRKIPGDAQATSFNDFGKNQLIEDAGKIMIMKKCTTVLILACVCFLSTHAQHSCKDCIYDLYKVLGTCQSKCIDIGDNTYSVKSLYQDKSDSIIFAAITKAHVFSYGNPLDSVVELDLGDKAPVFYGNY